ncbi:hypothetical protein V5799_002663 [Amblyomma americanum]|uniref:Schlafen AlbA-2 domain-containing protein n=1 Tax=Amblyomma americanum TaxID=6943 RepID=A0AAQ4DB64_AMBAM
MAGDEPGGDEVQRVEQTPCSEVPGATNEVEIGLPDASPHSSDDSWSSSDDEDPEAEERERSLRPSLFIDDVRVPDDAAACNVEKLEPQQAIPRFETLYEMTRKFVHYFTALHTERECVLGAYICTVCRSAQLTLAAIRAAIDKNPEGRLIALNNTNFMKLVVRLCSLESVGQPRICTVSSSQLEEYYGTRASGRKLTGVISVLDDQTSQKLWENVLGDAAKGIETLTYAFRLLGAASDAGDRGDAPKQAEADGEVETPNVAALAENASVITGSLDIARCIDARHFIVYRSSQMNEDIRAMAEYNRKVVDRDPREDPPEVGQVAGLIVSGGELMRVLVLKVVERVAVVWEIDHGRMHCVHWTNLVDILPAFRSMPPAVCLAVVLDVKAVPFLKLLRECVDILRSIVDPEEQESTFYINMVNKLTSLGAIDVLSGLIRCPDYETRMMALACLILLCHRHYGRQAVANAGLVDSVVAQLDELVSKRRGWQRVTTEENEKKYLLDLLRAMFFRNDQLRVDSADSELFAVLLKVRESTVPGNDSFHRCVERCLRSVLAPPPPRAPASSNNEYGYQRPFSGPTHRGGPAYGWDNVHQRSASRHSFARGVQMAMPPDRLESYKHSSRTLECYDGSEPLSPADFRPELTVTSDASIVGAARGPLTRGGGGCSRFFIRGMLVPLRSDETHELRTVQSMRQVSARTLANVACSFLNMWKPCTIYYGISADGYVRGVILSNEDKDNVRTGVDFMVGNLRPHLTSSSFSVEFVPVLRSAAEPPEDAIHYVVEVHVLGVPGTVYTTWEGDCFLRENGRSYQAFTHDVRAWVARMEEQRYRKAEEGEDKGDPVVPGIPAAAPPAAETPEKRP